jgi:hypothetical protein
MLGLSKHLYRTARVVSLTIQARCFDKLSMTTGVVTLVILASG